SHRLHEPAGIAISTEVATAHIEPEPRALPPREGRSHFAEEVARQHLGLWVTPVAALRERHERRQARSRVGGEALLGLDHAPHDAPPTTRSGWYVPRAAPRRWGRRTSSGDSRSSGRRRDAMIRVSVIRWARASTSAGWGLPASITPSRS